MQAIEPEIIRAARNVDMQGSQRFKEGHQLNRPAQSADRLLYELFPAKVGAHLEGVVGFCVLASCLPCGLVCY